VTVGNFNTTKTRAYTNASPITDFPRFKVTKVTFLSGEASDLPNGGIGTLETNRLSANDVLNYQMFYPFNNHDIYRRYWTASGWSVWGTFSPPIIHSETREFGSFLAGQTKDVTFTIPGVNSGGVATVNFPSGVAMGVIPFAYITANDTVVMRVINATSGAVNVGTRPVRIVVNNP